MERGVCVGVCDFSLFSIPALVYPVRKQSMEAAGRLLLRSCGVPFFMRFNTSFLQLVHNLGKPPAPFFFKYPPRELKRSELMAGR